MTYEAKSHEKVSSASDGKNIYLKQCRLVGYIVDRSTCSNKDSACDSSSSSGSASFEARKQLHDCDIIGLLRMLLSRVLCRNYVRFVFQVPSLRIAVFAIKKPFRTTMDK